MNLLEFKEKLADLKQLQFRLCDGSFVPEHFHITEVGLTTKRFIDCGGKVRVDSFVTFQLWTADDFDHRLVPEKFLAIIDVFQHNISIDNLEEIEIEVEYQSDTIGKYGLDKWMMDGDTFVLTNKQTDCLAKDKCGITVVQGPCCPPGGC